MRVFKQLLAVLCFFSVSLFARSLFEKAPIFSSQDLKNWVQQSGPGEFDSVESFLKKLPAAYRRYFVLQYRSQSLHQSTPEFPRVIFYGPDARILTGVSGYPNDPRKNTVEFIEYLEDEARYEFYSLEFNSGKKAVLTEGSAQCTRCHGRDPKPNWEPYNLWPGSYGSVHDTIFPGTLENQGFETFLKSFEKSPVYRQLVKPFYSEMETGSGAKKYFFLNNGGGANATFSILANYLNRDRVAKKIVADKQFPKYKNAIAAALLACDEPLESFLSPQTLADHPESFDSVLEETTAITSRDHDRRVRQVSELLAPEDEEVITSKADLYGIRYSEVRRIAALRYLFQKRNTAPLEVDRFSLALARTSYGFNDGVSGLENLIGHFRNLLGEAGDSLHSIFDLKVTPFDLTSYSDLSIPHHTEVENLFSVKLYNPDGSTLSACKSLK